jgi:hypothetical protein
MKKFVWLAACAIAFSTLALADHGVAVLDGTSWKLDVEPDAMAKSKGEKSIQGDAPRESHLERAESRFRGVALLRDEVLEGPTSKRSGGTRTELGLTGTVHGNNLTAR